MASMRMGYVKVLQMYCQSRLMLKRLDDYVIVLSAVLVLWPELSQTLPGKLSFHFSASMLRHLIPSFVSGQSQGDTLA